MKCSKPAAKHIFIRKKAAFAENPEALLPNDPAAQKKSVFLTPDPAAPSQKRTPTASKHAQRQGEG